MDKIIKYIIIVGFLFLTQSVYSQNKCKDELAKAIELYNAGLYEKAIEMLENNMKTCKYKNNEKKQALKYLAAAHYEIDNIEQGDKATYTFLKKEPLYEAQTTDPLLFIEALQKYEQYPSLSINTSLGLTRFKPIISEIYTVWDNADYTQEYIITDYTSFSNSVNKSLLKGLNFSFGINISNFTYGRKILFTDTTFINFKETSFEFKVPLELNYTKQLYKKISASVYAGVYYVRYNNPKVSLAGSEFGYDMLNQFIENSSDFTKFRNIDNVGASLGFSINYSTNRFLIHLKASNYVNGLTYTKKENGSITGLELNTYYADDLFAIREATFSLGVSYIFSYKVKSKY